MPCALVFYFVVTIFVDVCSVLEPCVIEDWSEGKAALCTSHSVNYTFDFIPPISQNISYISLSGQPLKQLPYIAFRNLSSQSSISEIWLPYCEISQVDAGALLNLHNLTVIFLEHNDIKQIDSKLFSDTKQIEYINLEYNKIEVLPSGLFQNLTRLKEVYLGHNRIRQVDRYSFKNTPSLRSIDLENNQIQFMDILFMDEIDNLETLWLYGNPWNCTCELGPLYELLKNMYILDQYGLVCEKPPALQGRKWKDVSRDKFVCPSEDEISAQDSVMTSTEPKTSSLPELCVIKYSYGQKEAYCGKYITNYTFYFIPPISQNILHISLTGQPLKQLPYNAFRNLSSQSRVTSMRLADCQIRHVDAGALLNLDSLRRIDLSSNDITQIDSKFFRHTKQIVYIFMRYNKIEVLPSGLFQNLTLLEAVYLNDNRIRQVQWYSFKNTPSLWSIDLGYNQIEFINVYKFKDKFDNLTYLWLADNPWKCDCELGPLYELLIQINQVNRAKLVCERPPTLQGKKWKDISRDRFVCPSDDAISTQESVITSTDPVTSTELLVTNGTILKLGNDQGIVKDAESVHIEEETSTTFETRKTVTDESSDKSTSKRKPETRIELSDITQRSLTNEEKQVITVDEETNSSETSELDSAESDTEAEGSITTEELTPTIESTKTPHEPVDDQIVTTTTDISFNSHEGADTNVQQVSNDLKWLPWTLFSVAIVCLLGCAARYSSTRYRRRFMPSVRRTEQATEETTELIYFHTAQQINC